MDLNDNMKCCGVKELSDIGQANNKDPRLNLIAFCAPTSGSPGELTRTDFKNATYLTFGGRHSIGWSKTFPERAPHSLGHIIFTQATEYRVDNGPITYHTYGDDLMKYIQEHNLGTVTRSEGCYNGNYQSGAHLIHVFVWQPNTVNLLKWYREQFEPAKTTLDAYASLTW